VNVARRPEPLFFLLWLAAIVVGLASRPILPIDETRYLTVAWEMHVSGNWLVPHLNGIAYHHKPPVLFWLINLVWGIAGVGDTAGRLVAPFFGFVSMVLTALLARLLWPGEQGRRIGLMAGLMLFASGYWLLFSTLTYFDVMMTAWTLMGLIGLVLAARGRWNGFILFALALGLGALTKGPVILVYLLPAALLAPLWAGPQSWLRWYGSVMLGIAAGAAIGLAWALPAARAGGEEFGNALLWGQTAGRVRDSFAHREPFWWYVPVLPLIVFPWFVWPPFWRAVRGLRAGLDLGARLSLVWFLVGLLVFSAISGKQPHYILPLVPAFLLFVAVHLAQAEDRVRQRDLWFPAALVALLGLVMLAVPLAREGMPHWFARLRLEDDLGAWPHIAAGLLVLAGAMPAFLLHLRGQPLRLVAAGVPLVATPLAALHLFLFPAFDAGFYLKPTADVLALVQKEGRATAFVGDYHGEYQYLGRLARPLEEIEIPTLYAWARANPDGVAVTRARELPTHRVQPLHVQPWRGSRFTVLWESRAILQAPETFGGPR
jgi:4-amino-4-deoxy-L-arabinose transferase-like glycosyltransferase